ncbi:MAG: tyrosine-type recombinase/integrase [Geminicoccaceae bacterium]
MAREFVYRGEWKGDRLTAPALAAVEKAWREDSTAAGRLEVLSKLTAGEIGPEDIRCADRLVIKDTDVRGLELRLSRTGARSWAISMRRQGVQRRFTLESSGGMTLAEARKAAAEEKARILKGADPVEERREQRRTAAAVRGRKDQAPTTLRDVLDAFERAVAKPKAQRSWETRRKHLEAEYRAHLDLPAADLSPADIRKVLDAAAERGSPVAGWHGFRYLKRIMAWAARRELVPADPTASVAREEVLDTVRRERQRDRVLSPGELKAVWTALERYPASAYACIYRMILLTGQRPNEVATMQWPDVDLERAEWVQSTNKSDRRHVVPLSREALDIVSSRDRRGSNVFTNTAGGKLDAKAGNWDRFTKMVAKESGVTGWSRHDLRRTAATLLAEAKVAPVVVEQLLNHAESAGKGGMVAAIYNRHSYAMEKRQAVEKLAEIIGQIATSQRGKVVEMQPAGAG